VFTLVTFHRKVIFGHLRSSFSSSYVFELYPPDRPICPFRNSPCIKPSSLRIWRVFCLLIMDDLTSLSRFNTFFSPRAAPSFRRTDHRNHIPPFTSSYCRCASRARSPQVDGSPARISLLCCGQTGIRDSSLQVVLVPLFFYEGFFLRVVFPLEFFLFDDHHRLKRKSSPTFPAPL